MKKITDPDNGAPRSAAPPPVSTTDPATPTTSPVQPLLAAEELAAFDQEVQKAEAKVGIAGLDSQDLVDEDQVVRFLQDHAYTVRYELDNLEAWPPDNGSPRLKIVRMPRLADPAKPGKAFREIGLL